MYLVFQKSRFNATHTPFTHMVFNFFQIFSEIKKVINQIKHKQKIERKEARILTTYYIHRNVISTNGQIMSRFNLDDRNQVF